MRVWPTKRAFLTVARGVGLLITNQHKLRIVFLSALLCTFFCARRLAGERGGHRMGRWARGDAGKRGGTKREKASRTTNAKLKPFITRRARVHFDDTGAIELLSTRSIVLEGRQRKRLHKQIKCASGALPQTRCKTRKTENLHNSTWSIFDDTGAVDMLSTDCVVSEGREGKHVVFCFCCCFCCCCCCCFCVCFCVCFCFAKYGSRANWGTER